MPEIGRGIPRGGRRFIRREGFSYRTETLVALAERHGLAARHMDDWEKRPHGQSKIRVTRPSAKDHRS
ncbi:hypothetical protein ACFUTV_04600 [Streptomyces sp. NPDC057298]|uniref:hypothetical protein n=1 Tax=Streptomyces sp. NPDC057298 TaxID=3346091 RepID=UPI003628F43D